MAFCTNCGNQVADGMKFCTVCGTAVAAAATAAPPVITEPATTSATTLTVPVEPAAPPVQQPVQQAPVQQPVQPQPVYAQAAPQPAAQQPLYAPQPLAPAAVYQEEPITTGSYIGIFFLLMIPVVNLICLIVWACGGCAKRNKTNLSRALLIWMLIGTVLGGLAFLAGSLLFGDTLDSIRELGSQINAATGE